MDKLVSYPCRTSVVPVPDFRVVEDLTGLGRAPTCNLDPGCSDSLSAPPPRNLALSDVSYSQIRLGVA